MYHIKMCSLRENRPNTEFFSGPNVEKYDREKTSYLDTFHAVVFVKKMSCKEIIAI